DVLVYLSPIKWFKLDRIIGNINNKMNDKVLIHKVITSIKDNLKKINKKLVDRKVKIRASDLSRKLIWKLTNSLFDKSDLIISPSNSITRELIKYKTKPRVVTISNGIETKKFRCKTNYNNTIRKFLHVGRIGFEKKIDVVIISLSHVIKKYPDICLTIVGDGPAILNLKMIVAQKKLGKNIIFKGFVNRDDLPEIYRQHDVFITASEMETQGLVIIEAMASGLPVIGVNVLAIPDVVHHNITGYLALKGDARDIAKYMQKFVVDAPSVKKMGKNARKEAEKHDIDHCMKKLERTYLEVSRMGKSRI
ncbi:MAG: glycosyltransferase, partial [archaeon]